MRRCSPSRPAFLLTATINWDLLAALFAVFALYAWGRRMPVLTGILIGLGAATKLWPAFLLVPLVLIGWRARRLGDALFAVVDRRAQSWFAVNLPVMMLYFDSWNQFFKLNYSRDIDWGTLWYIGQHVPLPGNRTGIPPFTSFGGTHIGVVNVLSYTLFGLALVGLALLTYLAPRRPRVAQLAFLTVAAFLIFSKVWSQQYVLWLLPLAILARPRWGAFIAWQCAEICYFFAFDGELMRADGNPIFPEGVFVLAASLRLITVVILCVYVVRDIMRPERDVVLATYGDDPDGGVFNNAEDRWEVMAGLAPPSRLLSPSAALADPARSAEQGDVGALTVGRSLDDHGCLRRARHADDQLRVDHAVAEVVVPVATRSRTDPSNRWRARDRSGR